MVHSREISLIYLIINIATVIAFSVILIIARLILSRNVTYSREKATPFECGFDPADSGRLPFSIRFFLLAIIFLIFDIEIALLFPLILGLKLGIRYFTLIASSTFLFILLAGLLHEWRLGTLRWIK